MAIIQQNIKRLLAYSSIVHVGFVLMGLVGANAAGVQASLTYIIFYIIMTLGAFAVLLSLHRRGVFAVSINDFSGLGKTSPKLAFAMLVFMFSLAGIPPFAGFFAKYFVLSSAINSGFTWLAISGVVFSVIAAYYSLLIVKVMYFNEPSHKYEKTTATSTKGVVFVMAVLTITFGIFPDYISNITKAVAASLF